MKPIYKPKGAAKEYGDLALNIYTGCPHRCFYCFAPNVLHKGRETFHSVVEPRKNIVEETRKQLQRENITGKTIHLCFTCDPYPTGYDTTTTREIIKLLKDSGNHVQILTKGDGTRDFDLLDSGDWYGVTLDGTRNNYCRENMLKIQDLYDAKARGIKTWVSFEPVVNAGGVLKYLRLVAPIINKVKIGKLNYHPSQIEWGTFGRIIEKECQTLALDYYIKESLRAEMEREENAN